MVWLYVLLSVLLTALVVFLLMNTKINAQKSAMENFETRIAAERQSAEKLLGECRANYEGQLENMRVADERQLAEVKAGYQRQLDEMKSGYEKQITGLKEGYSRSLDDLKVSNAETVRQLKEVQEKEMKAVVDGMKAETEKLLKSREESLSKGNKDSMDSILQPLRESMEQMKKTMQDNQETHIKNTSELGQKLEQAVKEMSEKTREVGSKADNLSMALTGKSKVQGCWGEDLLETMLANEGFLQGVHYDREKVNSEGRRPDFIFYFKEGGASRNLIVDSKVSLTAYAKYMSNDIAKDEKDAYLKEHMDSIYKHIAELAKKDYAGADKKSFAKYVLMFLPIDNALRIAMDEDPMLWRDAYNKGVIIVTEQTIMPFLKILSITWTKFQQDSNIEAVSKAATTMIERVAAFYESYKSMGKKLNAVINEYNSGIVKLAPHGQSITTSANQVISLGVKTTKTREIQEPQAEIPTIEVVD